MQNSRLDPIPHEAGVGEGGDVHCGERVAPDERSARGHEAATQRTSRTGQVTAAWVWLDPQVLLAVHDEQLSEHGGATGTRDPGLFESALARPQHLAHYEKPDAAALAAAYGCGIAC